MEVNYESISRNPVGNIDTLQPFANSYSNLKYPCVYLSTSKALSAIYIWDKPYKWMTFEIREDGMPVYNESFKDALYEFYNNVSGYIYSCEEDFDIDDNTKIRCAVISKKPVVIKEIDKVKNAYKRILQYEKQGLIVINRYENLSDERIRKDRNMVLGTIKSLNLLKGEHPLSNFVKEKFPEYWEESINLLQI